MTRSDRKFLTTEGERAWTWLRRHLDRANAFWLAFILTDDLAAQRVLRERVRANRRLRAYPLVVLQPDTPGELAELLDELELRGAAPPGCTWVAAPRLADDEWLAAWRSFLRALNHRRDVLRTRLGGLVIVAPPAIKTVAQRESPDLWSVRDLLIELAPQPAAARSGLEPSDRDEPRERDRARGLSYGSDDTQLAEEAQILLAMPITELAGPARERVSRAVLRAADRHDTQLAAVLLLALSDGYRAAGDIAGAMHLVQEGLTLVGVEPRTRERLLNTGAELATAVADLESARHYAAELVRLTEHRTHAGDPQSQRDLARSLTTLGNVVLGLDSPTTAATHYQQALDIFRRLADPDDPQTQRDLSVGLEKLGDVTRDLGDLTTARTYHQQALDIDIARRLADPDDPQTQRDLSVGLQKLGDVTRDLGDLTTARTYHQQALDLSRRLADPDDPQTQRDLSVGLQKLGDVTRDLGDLTTARTYHQQALEIRRHLARQLDTLHAHRDLAWSLVRLGDIARDLGDPTTAATHYEQALDIYRRLASQLDTPQAHRDLARSLARLGDVTRDLRDLATATTYYEQALDIDQRLADQLNTPQALRSLTSSLTSLGTALRELGEPAAARLYHEQALDIAQRTADQRAVLVNLDHLGDVARDLGNLTSAYDYHQQAVDIARRLADQLGTSQARYDLAVGLQRLGDIARDLGDPTTAATHYRQTLEIARLLAEQLGTGQALRDLRTGLGDLAKAEEQLGNTERAIELRAEAASVSDQLAALTDDPSDH